MTAVNIRSRFKDEESYRLLSISVEEMNFPFQKRSGMIGGSATNHLLFLVLKGEKTVVAHGEQHAWLIRRVEYSNSLLLASRCCQLPTAGSSALMVVACLSRVFETAKRGAQRNVMSALRDSCVTLTEMEDSELRVGRSSARLFTFSQLARQNFIGTRDLAELLSCHGALVHRRRVRLLDPADTQRILNAVLSFVQANGPACTSWTDVVAHLSPSPFPAAAVAAVRAIFGASDEAAAVGGGDAAQEDSARPLFAPARVAVSLAEYVFQHSAATQWSTVAVSDTHGVAVGRLPFDVFFPEWYLSIPPFILSELEMSADLPGDAASARRAVSVLRGSVVFPHLSPATFSTGATAIWVPERSLPDDLGTRLRILFDLHDERWALEDIRPYVSPVLFKGETFENTIHRYAREYRVPDRPIEYSKLGA